MVDAIIQLLDYALRVASRIDRAAGRSTAYTGIAAAYLEYGQKARSLEVLEEEALKSAGAVKQPEEKSRQLTWIAGVLEKAGDSEKAKELFTSAILLARATESADKKAVALHNIACEYADAGLIEEADRVLTELHEIVADPENATDTACELASIARIYADTRRNEKAGEVLGEALKITAELKDHWFRAERLIEAAEIYADTGHAEKAARILEEASAVILQIDKRNRPHFLLKIAGVYANTGEKSKAREILTSTLGIVNTEELPQIKSGDITEMAAICLELGDAPESMILLNRAIESARRIENIKDRVSSLTDITGLLSRAGGIEKALDTAGQAASIISAAENRKALIYQSGNLALQFIGLNKKDKAEELISRIIQAVQDTGAKTAGLGEIARDLSANREFTLALSLVQIIREPHVRAEALTTIARDLIEAGGEPGEEVKQIIQNMVNSFK